MIKNMQESAHIEKPDGAVVGPYVTTFAGDTVVINDPAADVDEGDTVLRTLPSGKTQRLHVMKATFYNASIGHFGPHFQLRVGQPKTSPVASSQHFNFHGAQSVQIGDHNNQNIVNSFEALVKQIDATEAPAEQKEDAKSKLRSFLTHPLTVAVLGAAAKSVLD